VRIDPDTGLLASPGQSNAIFEYFLKENVPSRAGGETGPGEGSGGTDDLLRDIF
jgi:penicillin-binding protein 1A